MKFYKRFPGDITIKTGHLSPAEFGVYDRLLDHYYATERPLPASVDDCCSIARTRTKDDRKAVERVLGEFFSLTGAGWEQQRAEEMIAEAQPKIEAARANGKRGGRPKKNQEGTEQKPTGFPEETQEQPVAKASQSQSTSTSLRAVESAVEPAPPKRAVRKCPAGFEITDELRDWVSRSHPTVNAAAETEKFRDHTFKTPISDWSGAWRNWMRKAAEFSSVRGAAGATGETPWQRSQREKVAAFTGGILGRAPGEQRTIDPEVIDA